MRCILTALLLLTTIPVLGQVTSGTAFAVAPQLLITNQHVVAGCDSIEVLASDGRRVGSVIEADPQIDLALLRVSGLRGATATLRNPRTVRLGETAMVFGFPLAGSLSTSGNFTSGLVSALQGLRNAAGQLQITAPVQPGNSGGPLLDSSGNVIGVVSSKLDALRSAIASGDIPQNVNFAISLDVLADFLTEKKVPFRNGSRSASLDSARIAELAQGFTYRVECRGKAQQAKAPSPEPRQLQSCLGTYRVETWTNCTGVRTFPNGERYRGEFEDGMRSGQGTLTWPDGSQYVGEWRDDKRNGQGVLTLRNGEKYVGEFKDGRGNGQGTRIWPNGNKYVGEFSDGRSNGHGTLTLPNGEKSVGEFRGDNFFNGQGTITWTATGEKYVGEFANGKPHGQGTFTWPDGRKYVGDVKDGKHNGQGTFTAANGEKSVGEFKDGKFFNGHGTLIWSDGRKYVGDIKGGKLNGQGISTWPDGSKYVGEYTDNQRNGQGTLTSPDGKILKSGIWENGKIVGSK